MGMKRLVIFGVVAGVAGAAYWILAGSRLFTRNVPYVVVERDGKVELRSYGVIPEATVEMGAGENGAFMQLFRFITGSNAEKKKIAMTSPVFIEGNPDEGRRMSFAILPEEGRVKVPLPDSAQVTVSERKASLVAASRFAGSGRKAEKAAIENLRKWLEQKGRRASGAPIIAYYDAPFVPGPLRRNEVIIPLVPEG